ncbi:MAG: hypothetical protein IIB63_10525 [Proteobacteria bacterium]|nr:hypothetical protein [Pseudomonadota bacterium]
MACVGVVSVVLFLLRDETLPAVTALLALVIIWLGLVPVFLYLRTPREERPPFPLMPLSGLFYAAFFGLPAFFAFRLRDPETEKINFFGNGFIDAISLEAQTLVIGGMALMWAAYAGSRRTIWRSIPHLRLPHAFSAGRLRVLLWALAAGYLAYLYSPVVRSLPSVGQFLQPVGYLAFGMFYLLWCRRELPRWQAVVVLLVLLPLGFLALLTTGFLTPILMFGVFFAVLYLHVRGRPPWLVIVAIPVFFLVAYPTMTYYRGHAWGAAGQGMTTVEKAQTFVRAVMSTYGSAARGRFDRETMGLVWRVSLILTLTHVVDKTPDPVPYWGGETYKPLFTSMIPRAVWPGKPEERTGNAFGRRYGVLVETERQLSFNLPWITEMYANFGRAGVILGMALVGLLFGFLERFLARPGMTALEFVTGATILLPLFFQESNFSLMTGSLLPLTVSLWLYFTVGLRVPLPDLRFSRRKA